MIYDALTIRSYVGNSEWRAWRADLAKYRLYKYSGLLSETFWALTIYRLQRGLQNRRPRWLWLPARLLLGLAKKFITIVTHINLPATAQIGAGMLMPHVGPIQLHPNVVIGIDCCLMHVVTLGAGSKDGVPVLGDHVFVGCHAAILGPVKIGNFVDIGAGAVVLKDVPDHHIAVGVPAKAVLKPPKNHENQETKN